MITLGFFEEIDDYLNIIFQPVLNIEKTPSNYMIITPFKKECIKQYKKHHDNINLVCHDIVEFIIATKCNVRYVVAEFELSKTLQKLADDYMYDTKVLAIIDNETKLKDVALNGIDGAINKSLLKS